MAFNPKDAWLLVGVALDQKDTCCGGRYVARDDTCVPDVICKRSHCPLNAHCSEADGHCRCDEGYIADITSNLCLAIDGGEATSASGELATSVRAPLSRPTLKEEFSDSLIDAASPELLEMLDATEESCKDAVQSPNWGTYVSLYYPPSVSRSEGYRSMIKKLKPKTLSSSKKKKKVPSCSAGDSLSGDADWHAAAIASGFGSNSTDDWGDAMSPDNSSAILLKNIVSLSKWGKASNGVSLLDELGHRIAIKMNKQTANPYLIDLAVLWWRVKGHGPKASRCIWRLLTIAPNEPMGYVHAATVMLRAGRLDASTQWGKMAYEKANGEPIVAFLNGVIQAARGDTGDAQRTLANILHENPKHLPSRDLLVVVRCIVVREQNDTLAELEYERSECDLPDDDAATAQKKFMGETAKLRERLDAIRVTLTNYICHLPSRFVGVPFLVRHGDCASYSPHPPPILHILGYQRVTFTAGAPAGS